MFHSRTRVQVDVAAVAVGTASGLAAQNAFIRSSQDFDFSFVSFLALDAIGATFIRPVLFACNAGEYLVSDCTGQRDTVCAPCRSSCAAGQHVSGTCQASHDFSCSQCAASCATGSFVSEACNGVTNTQCSPCSGDCSAGQCVDSLPPLCPLLSLLCSLQRSLVPYVVPFTVSLSFASAVPLSSSRVQCWNPAYHAHTNGLRYGISASVQSARVIHTLCVSDVSSPVKLAS